MDELDALRGMRTALAEEERPERIALRAGWRADPAAATPAVRRRTFRRVPLIGLAATATAAVVAASALAVVSATSEREGPGGGPGVGPGEAGPPAKEQGNVLLVAATNAQRAGGGRYWHYRRTLGEIFAVGKTVADHYKVDSKQTFESWTERNGASRGFMQDPPATPVTAQDRRKWLAAGAPAVVHAPFSEGTASIFMKADAGGRTPVPSSPPGEKWNGLSPKQIAELPTDAKALEKALLNLKGHWEAVSTSPGKKRLGTLRGAKRVRALSEVAGELLSVVPAPPKVRAAAFRMLEAQPGVRAEGQGADPMGRAGAVISLPVATTVPIGLYTAPKQLGTYRRQWIIDPASGTLLAIRDLVVKPPRGSLKLPPGDDGKPRALRARDMPDRFHRPGELASYALFEVTEWTDLPPR